ncbi:hypothetical protein F2P81_017503 [Scophthalmus maximus]|uniref:Uncharacterized protein n=1 Tax=Scophthalmus maximus TaxID=52904 RepID=A0A6A4SK79_SCOMX|nr:hypothetical protein F2P81_017503 [Scophthalmus maximus]
MRKWTENKGIRRYVTRWRRQLQLFERRVGKSNSSTHAVHARERITQKHSKAVSFKDECGIHWASTDAASSQSAGQPLTVMCSQAFIFEEGFDEV